MRLRTNSIDWGIFEKSINEEMTEKHPHLSTLNEFSPTFTEFDDNIGTLLLTKYEYLVESINKSILRAQNPHTQLSSSPRITYNISPSKIPSY